MMSCKTNEFVKVDGLNGEGVPKFENKKFDEEHFGANKKSCFEGSNIASDFKPSQTMKYGNGAKWLIWKMNILEKVFVESAFY